MSHALPCTVFDLGSCTIHQLHSSEGKIFVMGEVASELFNEVPAAFLTELRKGRYHKITSDAPSIMLTVAQLGLPVEPTASTVGVTLLPTHTVEALMLDRRRHELLHPFKLTLLKFTSQEATSRMAADDYEGALGAAMDAVKQGQELYRGGPALQMFPLYLLAGQANLGLQRLQQCEDFLTLAAWLALKEPSAISAAMHCQLARLYGQLYSSQGKLEQALKACAEAVYYSSLDHGPEHISSCQHYLELAQVFLALGPGHEDEAMACMDQVVAAWAVVLQAHVLGVGQDAAQTAPLPAGAMQQGEAVAMLSDIAQAREQVVGQGHRSCADAHFIAALALAAAGKRPSALGHLQLARSVYASLGDANEELMDLAQHKLEGLPA